MSVGDLSRKSGGQLDRHHSHESGRDADIGFYIRNAKRPILPVKFVAFSAAGGAPAMPGAVFDDARNWALIEALIDDTTTRVSYIFVVAHVRARLLRYAEKMGVPRALRERAAEVMMQPRRAAHDDHFHIRIACPREQRNCVEQAVVYAPRTRPAVGPRTRQRAGTADRGRSLPVLPMPPKGVGSVASYGDPVQDLDVSDTLAATVRTDDEAPGAPRPLANAAEADNVER
jgi:penicillin-insensitive murein endopeptidase